MSCGEWLWRHVVRRDEGSPCRSSLVKEEVECGTCIGLGGKGEEHVHNQYNYYLAVYLTRLQSLLTVSWISTLMPFLWR